MQNQSTLFVCKTYEEKFSLTEEMAIFRASLIENVSYRVNLAVLKGDTFYGTVGIKFTLKEVPKKSIGIDFVG